MFYLILFEYENKLVYTKRGSQSSYHLITGRNVKDVSLENALTHIDLVGKIILKGVAIRLPHDNR